MLRRGSKFQPWLRKYYAEVLYSNHGLTACTTRYPNRYSVPVEQAYLYASKTLLDLLITKEKLMTHLQYVRQTPLHTYLVVCSMFAIPPLHVYFFALVVIALTWLNATFKLNR